MPSFPELPYENTKEILLHNSPLLKTFLNFPLQKRQLREIAIQQEVNKLSTEKIDPHLGPLWPALALKPFIQLGDSLELFNEQLGEENTEITTALWCIGYELENYSNLNMFIEDIHAVLRKLKYFQDNNIKDITEQTQRDIQMESFIDDLFYHAMTMRRMQFPTNDESTITPELPSSKPKTILPDSFIEFINNINIPDEQS